MALDKHIDVERKIEMATQIRHALCFRLTASISEQNEGDPVVLKIAEGFGGARERRGTSEEDAIDTRKS